MEIVSVPKSGWLIIRLGSSSGQSPGCPVFRISLSYSAVIIYLTLYVVCQGKTRECWQSTSPFGFKLLSPNSETYLQAEILGFGLCQPKKEIKQK
jgi:hypothetical protein